MDPMIMRRLLPAAVAAAFLCGCATSETTTTTSLVTQHRDGTVEVDARSDGTRGPTDTLFRLGPSVTDGLPRRFKLARPADAVFVGISNFNPGTGIDVTSAHALGAAMGFSLFRGAAARAQRAGEGVSTVGGVTVIGASRIQLEADLRLDPIDPTWKAREVAHLLDSLPGMAVYPYSSTFSLPKDRLWPYIQRAEPLGKQQVLQLARDQAARLKAAGETKPMGVFYLATHGKLANNGTRYALAADSLKDDPSTWISYQELADAFRSEFDPSLPVSLILMLDTCLVSDDPQPAAQRVTPSDGVLLVSSAAPGEYSWHWTHFTELEVIKATRGSGPFKENIGPRNLSHYSKMSVLPMAMSRMMRLLEDDCAEDPTGELEVLTVPDFQIALDRLVPRLARAGQARAVQHVQSFVSPVTATHLRFDFPTSPLRYRLFSLDCTAPKKETTRQ